MWLNTNWDTLQCLRVRGWAGRTKKTMDESYVFWGMIQPRITMAKQCADSETYAKKQWLNNSNFRYGTMVQPYPYVNHG